MLRKFDHEFEIGFRHSVCASDTSSDFMLVDLSSVIGGFH